LHESPSSSQLLSAVSAFLTDVAMPQLVGHAQFSARVSANALSLVARELDGREAMDSQAASLYASLLGQNSRDLATLEAELCKAIAIGDMSATTPGLLAALRAVTVAQLAIDQPNYSGLSL
jgi:hypothetical protein